MLELTQKQKLFANEYILTGNASQSYKKVYDCSDRVANVNSARMLVNASIKKYIEELNIKMDNNKIADMIEVKEFWTETLRSKEVERKDRLKASEYLAKTNAAFMDRVQHSGEVVIFEGFEDEDKI